MTSTRNPVGPGSHVFLVDGSSFVFRAYFQSVNQDSKYNYRSDGLPTGAVRLFSDKVECASCHQAEYDGAKDPEVGRVSIRPVRDTPVAVAPPFSPPDDPDWRRADRGVR